LDDAAKTSQCGPEIAAHVIMHAVRPAVSGHKRSGLHRTERCGNSGVETSSSTRANSNKLGLHSVGTGRLLCSALDLCLQKNFRRSQRPGAPTLCEKCRLTSAVEPSYSPSLCGGARP
jgi:hypothetical protein